jgi:hypothetical protein
MSDVATVVGSMFVVTSGEAAVGCPKASQPRGKGVHQVFADAAPLAKLREEIRSYEERVAGADRREQMKEPEVVERETEPAESRAAGDRPQPESKDDATEAAEEETTPLEVALPVSEVAVEIDAALPASQSVEAEVADLSAPAEVEVASASGVEVASASRVEVASASRVEVTTDVSLVSERQSPKVVARAASDEGRVFNQVQAGAATETADG